MSITACKLVIRTTRLAQRVTAGGQLDVVYRLHGYITPTQRINMIPSIHGRSGSIAIHVRSYNMLEIWMYVGQTKHFLEVGTKKIKMQHNLVTSRSQMCVGAKPPYPMENATSN